ncbi:MAG: glycosyltransferase family 4 protein [Bacteroidetes bacterium]|nr:glycosyltransferase family 4 protein [Bacteroidota bacterium]
MKILFITDGLYPFVIGGMQKHATYVLQRFANTEDEVTVITTGSRFISEDEFATEIFEGQMPSNIRMVFVPFPASKSFPGHYIWSSWSYSKKIGKIWSQRLKEFDIVYAKGFSSWYLLKKKRDWYPPVVVQLHGLEMFQKPYGFRDKLVKRLLRIPASTIISRCDYIFSYGGKIRELLVNLGVSPNRILEQYGAADAFWINPEPEMKSQDVPVMLMVARYEFRKGHHILNAALQTLIQSGFPLQLNVIGEVPETARVHHPKIHYLGNRQAEYIKNLADNASLILLPSLAEGFPTILVEAMARGLAPIATNVGAVASIVNSENGWLISPDSASALANAIKEACSDSHILHQKRMRSRNMVLDQFQWDSMFQSLVSHLHFIRNDHR